MILLPLLTSVPIEIQPSYGSYSLRFLLCVMNMTNLVAFTAAHRKASITLFHYTLKIEFS